MANGSNTDLTFVEWRRGAEEDLQGLIVPWQDPSQDIPKTTAACLFQDVDRKPDMIARKPTKHERKPLFLVSVDSQHSDLKEVNRHSIHARAESVSGDCNKRLIDHEGYGASLRNEGYFQRLLSLAIMTENERDLLLELIPDTDTQRSSPIYEANHVRSPPFPLNQNQKAEELRSVANE